eukprot:NODE_5046_length_725_cov_17.717456_g4683_i0.p1 GENE.NODE_5046_length_725_cov_17.717456_g4683_i0~~NODE_5046_length_725_cov_17.717456_g4683_i0.p1  ORF type:complete len:175 (-),score=20.81 NODE_5046_length_725_cov_17.717456_g4683_i0:38-562(-)
MSSRSLSPIVQEFIDELLEVALPLDNLVNFSDGDLTELLDALGYDHSPGCRSPIKEYVDELRSQGPPAFLTSFCSDSDREPVENSGKSHRKTSQPPTLRERSATSRLLDNADNDEVVIHAQTFRSSEKREQLSESIERLDRMWKSGRALFGELQKQFEQVARCMQPACPVASST